jgi:hypothetical protein
MAGSREAGERRGVSATCLGGTEGRLSRPALLRKIEQAKFSLEEKSELPIAWQA